MSKHDSGPWEIVGAGKYVGVYVRIGSDILPIAPLVNGSDYPSIDANARLIAAAPELLEALKLVQARLCEHCPQSNPGEPGEHADECIIAMDAIDKAEGKEGA